MATSCLGHFWFWMNSHIPWCWENPLILTKRGKENKGLWWVWILGGVTSKGSCWLVCVSDSSRILEAAAIAAFKRPLWVHLQRPGSWVTSSWGCISQSLIEEMTGLAWHGQCKCLECSRISKATHNTHSFTLWALLPRCWWTVFGDLHTLFSINNKGFHS